MKYISVKLLEDYSFLKISSSDELGGKNNPFKLLCLRDLHYHTITNNIYTENLELEPNCNIKIDHKAQLQIQSKIVALIYSSVKSNKFIKQHTNKSNYIFVSLYEKQGNLEFHQDFYEIYPINYGTKNNPIHKLIIQNNVVVKGDQEIFVDHLLMNNSCEVKLDNCRLNIIKSILTNNEVEQNFKNSSDGLGQLLGIEENLF